MTRHALVVRPDRLGDVLICGPAVRAVAAEVDRVTLLTSPAGAPAAALLPGVDDVLVWDCPWIGSPPAAVDRADVDRLVGTIAAAGIDEALILTSFHQSPLPTALLLRLAGVARIAAVGIDYPGSLLDLRLADPPDAPEPVRMLAIAEAAGYRLPADDDGRLAVQVSPLPTDVATALPAGRYVVAHPGVDAPARALPVEQWRSAVAALAGAGRSVVVTGSAAEQALAAEVAGVAATGFPVDAAADESAERRAGSVVDLAGRTDVAGLARVLAGADVLVAANTGPAHLAAAVGTPVVSLFAPVVPAVRWAPYGVPTVLLGDQDAACAGSRARTCPVPGHPCLSGVDAGQITAAVERLAPVAVGAAR